MARADAFAEALTAEGYASNATTIASGGQLCQHHCPVAHVAAEFPQLCEAETRVISDLVGTHVQRLATIAHGDGVCTTYIPATVPGQAPRAPQFHSISEIHRATEQHRSTELQQATEQHRSTELQQATEQHRATELQQATEQHRATEQHSAERTTNS